MKKKTAQDEAHSEHKHPVPSELLSRYSPESDPDAEQDIARYVELEAPDEKVLHVELIKTERVLGGVYRIWDVHTDRGKWWAVTDPTNLYSQSHFPSLDYTLSFHIGLMMRVQSRSRLEEADPDPFDIVIRRQDQIDERLAAAVEPEDFQAIGVLLRENLLTLMISLRLLLNLPDDAEDLALSDFKGWATAIISANLRGNTNKEIRSFLINECERSWRLVSALAHDRSANKFVSWVAFHSVAYVISNLHQLTMLITAGDRIKCPRCNSLDIRVHFDASIPPRGAYYHSCGVCRWRDHPEEDKSLTQTAV